MVKRRRLTKIRVSDNVSSHPDDEQNSRDSERPTSNLLEQETTRTFADANESAIDSNETSDDDSREPDPTEKTRGPTLLVDIWNQPPEEKIVLKFDRQGQPIGDGSSLLASFLGTIGRNPELAPQGYADWRLVPSEYKVRCMHEIKSRFSFSKKREKGILESLGRKVKDFRGELKGQFYEVNKHNRTKLVNEKPSRVPKDQWLKLISYWDHEKTKRRATTNRTNQGNQKMPHCAGRKSFAQLRAEKTVNGVEPSRAQIFIETHKDRVTREKNKIDEESARAKELMQKKLDELPGGVEQSNGKIAWKGDIFDQVINKEERHGRVRGVGGGICPTRLWGRSSTVEESSSASESYEIPSELIQKLLDDKMLEVQQKHDEEMRVMHEKHNNQAKELQQVLEKQDRLEEHIGHLIRLLDSRASEEGRSIFPNKSANNVGGRQM